MPEYAFNVTLFAIVRVNADSEEGARKMYEEALDAASVNAGAWPNGDPILFEASLEDPENDELIEIDGESV